MTTTIRPTAPLPQSAVAALSRLESAFPAATAELHRVERTAVALRAGESTVIHGTPVTAVSLAVAEAVTRYEIAVGRRAEIEAKPTREWSGVEFDSWARCEAVIVYSLTVLVESGSVDLVEVEDDSPFLTAARYRTAKALARKLGNAALDPELSDLDADSLAHAEDVMDGLRAALAKAGRLDLIGGGR